MNRIGALRRLVDRLAYEEDSALESKVKIYFFAASAYFLGA